MGRTVWRDKMIYANIESDTDLTYHDLHDEFFQRCTWSKLVKQISKRRQRACRLDITRCEEEGTEIVERIEEDYPVCKEHKRIYEGLKND